jgi:hypothetical protein
VCLLLLLLAAGAVGAHPTASTLRGLLRQAPAFVGIRSSPEFRQLGDTLADLATDAVGSNAPTSLAAFGSIDATQQMLGPIFGPSATVIGQGEFNVTVAAQRLLLEKVDGVAALGGRDGLLLLQSTLPRGIPRAVASAQLAAVRLIYEPTVRVAAQSVSGIYGLSDFLSVSVLLPLLTTNLDLTVTRDVVQVKTGGGFARVRKPTIVARLRQQAAGLGDLQVQLKYALSLPGSLDAALTLGADLPTGDPAQLHGSGTYRIRPGAVIGRRFLADRLQAELHAAANFDVRDATGSTMLYGASVSALGRRYLSGTIDLVGVSDLDRHPTPPSVTYLQLPSGPVVPRALLGVDQGQRVDTVSIVGSVRVSWRGLIGFASVSYDLVQEAFGASGLVPTVGVGSAF